MLKRVLVFAVLLSFVVLPGFAFGQPIEEEGPKMKRRFGEEMVQERIAELKAQLSLTPDQEAKIKDILTRVKEEGKSIIQDMNERMRELKAREKDEINAVLTEEQQAKLKEGRGGMGRRSRPGPEAEE